MHSDIVQHLAPTGILRAGVFTGNILLITGTSPTGVPQGVSPDMCQAIADQLGVKLELIPFKSQDELVESVASGACDIGLVGSDPARAKKLPLHLPMSKLKRPIWCLLALPSKR